MSDHDSSADPTGSIEFKAGHAPAIRVGGMRVGASRPRQTSQGDDKNSKETSQDTANDMERNNRQTNDDIVDDEQESGTVSNRVAGQMVSGTFVPIQKAFPTEAVKHTHDKPGTYPKHDHHGYSKHDEQRFLNQPRKQ